MKTVRSTWYEAWMKRSFGAKLDGAFSNKAGVRKAIKEAQEKSVSYGYKPDEYMIMIADTITVIGDDDEIVSTTTTYARA